MDNMNYKTCPLKRATGEDVLVFQNVDLTEEDKQRLSEEMKQGGHIALSVKTEDGPGYVGPAIGHCDREQCGWWDMKSDRCAVLSIARAITRK